MRVSVPRLAVLALAAVLILAALLTLSIAALFPPMTDADRVRMLIEQTEHLPQNR